MPLTPFVGLSVVIHLCTILGSRIISWFPKTKIKKPQRWIKLKSISIIIIVFVFIGLQASLLIRAGIIDNHSSVKYLSRLILEIDKSISSNKSNSVALSEKNIINNK